jgi:hypothetical protein
MFDNILSKDDILARGYGNLPVDAKSLLKYGRL